MTRLQENIQELDIRDGSDSVNKYIKGMDKYTDDFIRMGEYGISQSQGKTLLVGAVRASSDFISIKHFETVNENEFQRIIGYDASSMWSGGAALSFHNQRNKIIKY